jgi:diaminopimelate epimerase
MNANARMLPFFKYHGLGNDFVLIDAMQSPSLTRANWHNVARRMCDRRLGVGADELLLLSMSRTADATMRVFNADGTDGGMCGNGIRCIAMHLCNVHGFAGPSLRVAVHGVGTRTLHLTRAKGRFSAAEVDMGVPMLSPQDVPCGGTLANTMHTGVKAVIDAALPAAMTRNLGPVAKQIASMTCVSMGNPHAVLWCKQPARELVEAVGPLLQQWSGFPASVNVHVAAATSRSRARMWTYERGSGVTLACGTGACAVLVAGVLSGRLARRATVRVPGGDLRVRWDEQTGSVFKSGPAALVFAGEFQR